MHSSKKTEKNFIHCHASNIHLATRKNQTSCKSTEGIIRERTQCPISKEKGLNVVSLFEERTQCCIFSSVYI